jgi:5-methylcytosine-specific restriction endonuclease McrA
MTTSLRDVSALDSVELEDELATLAAHLYAGTCRWLELVAEVDRRGEWAAQGARSCAHWIAWRCGLDSRAAREHVRVARRLGELPLTHAAFAAGQLSYAKARALTRVATEDTEPELLDLARAMTAAQLERAVGAYRRVATREARDLEDAAHLDVSWDGDGSLVIRGRLAPEDGALLLRALEAMRDAMWERDRGSAEPRPARQASRAEALVAVAEAALAQPDACRPASERYQVVVHVEEAALTCDDDGPCVLDDGPAVAPETARRLACDASIVRHGRRSRAIPPRMRRALRARDRGCRFPGCENRRFLDAHHVHHWAKGGETTVENLLLLCRHHHRLVHEGGYSVDHDGRFYYPWGAPLPAASPLPRGCAGALVERNRGRPIDAATNKHGSGERCNLDDAVYAFAEIHRRAAKRAAARGPGPPVPRASAPTEAARVSRYAAG